MTNVNTYGSAPSRPQQETPVQETGTARLTYYIFEGLLVGIVNGKQLSISAYSGGAGGSYDKDAPTQVANNPYSYAVKEQEGDKKKGVPHEHGGPTPPRIPQSNSPEHSHKLGHHARLDPDEALPNDRGGMAIHGMGPMAAMAASSFWRKRKIAGPETSRQT